MAADYEYKLPKAGLSLNEGIGYRLMRVVFFVTLAVAVLGGYAVGQFRGLKQSDAMAYAHTARNLASGHGFVTRSRTPFDVWFLDQHGRKAAVNTAVPELHHAPGYPLLLAGVFRIFTPDYRLNSEFGIFDAEYKAIVPLGMVLTILVAGVLYWIGKGIFDARIAGVAAAVYLVSNLTLSVMASGLPVPLVSLLVTLACGLALRAIYYSAIGGHSVKLVLSLLGSGLCAGAAVLTDYAMIVLCAGVILLLGWQLQRLRWVGVALFVLVVGAIIGSWMLHNQKVGLGVLRAVPYEALHDSSLYQGDSLERSLAPKFNSYRVTAALRQKVVAGIAAGVSGRNLMMGGVVICFFLLSVFHRYERRWAASLRWLVVGALLSVMLLAPLLAPVGGIGVAFFPLVVLLGVSAFVDYIDREDYFAQGMQTLLIWVLVVLSALPAVAAAVQGRGSSYPPYYAPIQRFIASMLKDGETIYTDIPEAIAWYGNRSAMLIPNAIADAEKLTPGWQGVGGVYLTFRNKSRQADNGWDALFYQRAPKSFPFEHAIELPPGQADQLFLSDSPRWSAESSETSNAEAAEE